MSSVLPFTRLFPTSTPAVRITPAASPAAAQTAKPAAAEAESTAKTSIQNRKYGADSLVQTSLTGLRNFFKTLPARKTLLGE